MNSDRAAANAQDAMGVVCLCAAWCGVCRQYAPEFEALRARFPRLRFAWVDVEEEEDIVGDVDIETFPSLLIGQGEQALFFGPLLPQIQVLERLLASLLAGDGAAAVAGDQADALWQRVCKKWQ